MAYPINRTLMDSLEAVFLTQARNLLKDIAKEVGKPEKQLLAAFEKEKIKVHIVDREEDAYEGCMALVTCSSSALGKRCREPIYDGTCYCPLHLRLTCTPETAYEQKPKLQRIRTENDEIYFLDPLTQQLFTETYQRCGFVKNEKFVIFKLELPSEE